MSAIKKKLKIKTYEEHLKEDVCEDDGIIDFSKK